MYVWDFHHPRTPSNPLHFTFFRKHFFKSLLFYFMILLTIVYHTNTNILLPLPKELQQQAWRLSTVLKLHQLKFPPNPSLVFSMLSFMNVSSNHSQRTWTPGENLGFPTCHRPFRSLCHKEVLGSLSSRSKYMPQF